jgi:outer membrane receptor protein involved in Fe transport
MRAAALVTSIVGTLATTDAPLAAQVSQGEVLEEVTVFATPLGGIELAIDRVPGNIQRATGADIEGVRRAGLAQFLDQRVGSVFINEAQVNPLQPDVQFRGFVASPLLGQPQGIAVYQNGVRINDPFGDIVNWALVPEGAIASLDVIPGSNPVFGLNALGGAISLRTKNGFTDAGADAEVMYGSFGRTIAKVESGDEFGEGFSYYGNARYLEEDGWREHSPSDALHVFADIGWRGARTSAHLNLTRVDTDLIGNGPAPAQLLESDREAIYTHPDRTQNELTFLTLSTSHEFTDKLQLQGVAYSRRSDIASLNGDESPFGACDFDPQFVCDEDDEFAQDPDGEPILFDDSVEGAALNRGSTRQTTEGLSVQLGATTSLWGHDNRLIVGGSFDRSNIRFDSGTELARFDDERGAVGSGILVEDSFVALRTRIENSSVFLTDTFAINSQLDLTLSARYNDTQVVLRDQIGTALNGDHSFKRFNSGVGIAYRPTTSFMTYASYSESNRAPSPVELTCADEDDPCALPNAFLSDPPLEQVVARTIELGARGSWEKNVWHVGVFRTANKNDILFVSAGALTNHGFFENVGATRRQGIEMNLQGTIGVLDWFASYTRLQAQFRDSFVVMSPNNPAAIDGEMEVGRGARIPGVPKNILKTGASVALGSTFHINVDVGYQSDQFMRGDEANLTAPLPSYTVVNAGIEWQMRDTLTLFGQVENLLDREYATFGLYGEADEVLGDEMDDPHFVSPGAPRGVWVGFKWQMK